MTQPKTPKVHEQMVKEAIKQMRIKSIVELSQEIMLMTAPWREKQGSYAFRRSRKWPPCPAPASIARSLPGPSQDRSRSDPTKWSGSSTRSRTGLIPRLLLPYEGQHFLWIPSRRLIRSLNEKSCWVCWSRRSTPQHLFCCGVCAWLFTTQPSF